MYTITPEKANKTGGAAANSPVLLKSDSKLIYEPASGGEQINNLFSEK
ncbi:MAG: hypothetical protein LUD69_01045 [Oscillospiraceae bacterium]|nr:hypothetical protein [Oscillospiraceae bacterium]